LPQLLYGPGSATGSTFLPATPAAPAATLTALAAPAQHSPVTAQTIAAINAGLPSMIVDDAKKCFYVVGRHSAGGRSGRSTDPPSIYDFIFSPENRIF